MSPEWDALFRSLAHRKRRVEKRRCARMLGDRAYRRDYVRTRGRRGRWDAEPVRGVRVPGWRLFSRYGGAR